MSFLSVFHGRTVAKYVGETYTTGEERRGMFQRLCAAWQLVREADRRFVSEKRALALAESYAGSFDEFKRATVAPKEDSVKNIVQVVPTSNGYIVSITGQGNDYMAVVESQGRNPADVQAALGKAVFDLMEKAVPSAPGPAAPAPQVAPQPAAVPQPAAPAAMAPAPMSPAPVAHQ